MIKVHINGTEYRVESVNSKYSARLNQFITTIISEGKTAYDAYESILPSPNSNTIEVFQDDIVVETLTITTRWGRKYNEEKNLSFLFTSSIYTEDFVNSDDRSDTDDNVQSTN